MDDAVSIKTLTLTLFLGMLPKTEKTPLYLPRRLPMSQPPASYRLIPELKIRREAFGGILYKYGCADRGALSFINSPQLIELLIVSQQQHNGDLNAVIESHRYSEAGRQ